MVRPVEQAGAGARNEEVTSMREFLAVLVALAVVLVASPEARAGEGLVVKESAHSVSATLDRLTKVLESKGITIFTRIDHAAGAKKIGAALKPTELLIFGNPKLGTPLMQAERKIGLDLPLKALAWEDEAGKVWLAYTAPNTLKARHNVSGRDKVFKKMTGALDKLTGAAVKSE